MNKNIMIAMSGGVDSSVAALILKEKGLHVGGLTLRLHSGESVDDDIHDASMIAAKLDIPFFVADLREIFQDKVIQSFVDSYCSGMTPNPCVTCNKYIKFSAFADYAAGCGFERMATGHYARIEYDNGSGRFLLKKAADAHKDQTYMLYTLSQAQLARTEFPLGSYTKPQIRELAASADLATASKRESQDICFIPDGNYARYIETFLEHPYPAGNFVDENGSILGKHKGSIRYTIGQRKGLGLSLGKPAFVYEKDAQENIVRVGSEKLLFHKTLYADDINFIPFDSLTSPLQIEAKTRYTQRLSRATVEQVDPNLIRIDFEEPQRAIAPGQAVVMYDGDTVIGGGQIISCE